MFCGFNVFTLMAFLISTNSEIFKPPKSGVGKSSDENNSGGLCSEALNCTCLFEELRVTVKCTSAGDKLDKIAFQLPQTTTQL